MNGSSDKAKVNAVAMYLKGTMKLWWRNQVEDLVAGREVLPEINNWAEMKDALKAQFGLGNQSWLARNQLMSLKHSKRVQEYIKTFSGLMLEIKDMSKED